MAGGGVGGSCLTACRILVPRSRIEPAVEAGSCNHRITREVPNLDFLPNMITVETSRPQFGSPRIAFPPTSTAFYWSKQVKGQPPKSKKIKTPSPEMGEARTHKDGRSCWGPFLGRLPQLLYPNKYIAPILFIKLL